MIRRPALAFAAALVFAGSVSAQEPWESRAPDSVRIATFNVGLSRNGAGMLVREFAKDSPQIDAVVEIVLLTRPDILLVNELDRDPAGQALAAFAGRLKAGLANMPGLEFPFLYQGPVNSGVPSGLDLNRDGKAGRAIDAFGFGRYPGHYGMALLSRFPIATESLRSFQRFSWSALPEADRPMNPDGTPYHLDTVWRALRLSSKSLWDAPVTLPGGMTLHVIASHPTPPVFDGPEDLNGRRNADEIRLISALIAGADWLMDDAGKTGGLDPTSHFVVLGDLNADPIDGEARHEAIRALLTDPRLQDPRPASAGAAAAGAWGSANAKHRGDPALDTADWPDAGRGPGNLRVDYVLPSAGLVVTGAGVFWPVHDSPFARLVGGERRNWASSDHRLVWVDILPPAQ